MSLSCFVLWIMLFLNQHDVSLTIKDTTLLLPEKRNGTSHLNIRSYLWFQVELITFDEAYLLHFNKVCDVAMNVYSSFLISCTSVSSGSSGYKNKATVFSITFEIHFRYVAMNDWHGPSFLDQNLVKVFDQVMVP